MAKIGTMFKKLIDSNQSSLLFIVGLVIFTGLNCFSALTMDLHFDEAYYWIWSQFPAVGYFDHPPMVAWMSMAGQWLFNGEIGVRLLTIFFSSLSMIAIWRMVKRYSADAVLFWMLVFSVALLQPYAFIATPDAPLFFFATLFFYFYSRYLERNSFQNAVLLAFVIALMIYSKYHAFLLIGLVVISNLKLLKRFSFWFIVFHTIIYLIPHILWQIDNDFPSIRYHLFERHVISYSPSITFEYIVGQVLLAGPLLGWLFLYFLFSDKAGNKWESSLKFAGVGFYVFFLVSTFSGNVEAHWTLVAIIPLIILSYKHIIDKPRWKKWVVIAGSFNLVVLLLVRIIVTTPLGGEIKFLRPFSGNHSLPAQIDGKVPQTPIVFMDEWHDAALYSFYKGRITPNINSGLYRRNQFDLMDADEQLKGQTVTVITSDPYIFPDAEKIVTSRSTLYAKEITNFNSRYNLKMTVENHRIQNDSLLVQMVIDNPYPETIVLGKTDNGTPASFQLITHNGKRWIVRSETSVASIVIPADNRSKVQVALPVDESLRKEKKVYFELKIGELNPIPSKFLIDFSTLR